MNTLLLCDKFYSIQGEGLTTGYPSYFIRLALCNLNCGSSPKEISEVRKNPSLFPPGGFIGETHKQGKASFTCDTIPQWVKGTEIPFQQIIDDWKTEGVYEDIKNGLIHIIFTGGEPTLPKHQQAIYEFIHYWKQLDPSINKEIFGVSTDAITPFIEIETNGTVFINDHLIKIYLSQINCSPKLENSGNDKRIRYNEKALQRIMEHSNYQFKFVISKEEDLKEIFNEYVNKFNIPLHRVICMPGLDNQENFHERTKFVYEMSKKYKFIAGSRMHISAWGSTVSV